MENQGLSSQPEVMKTYGKDLQPRRRTDVVDVDVPEFLPEPATALVVKQKKKNILPEITHSQGGKRKIRETVGVHKQRDLQVPDELLKLPIGKRTYETRRGNRLKESRVGRIPREQPSDGEVTPLEPSGDQNFENHELVETEKPEFQLPAADLLRLGGIAAVEGKDLFPEMYGKNGVESEERANIETRLSRFQNPNFLNIKNREGKTVEEIIQEYINTIAKFLDEHGDEVKNLRLAWGYKNAEEHLARYIQFLVRWYPKTFSGGDDYSHISHDRLLDKLRDGLNKAFENSLSYPREAMNETEQFKKRRHEMEGHMYELVRKIYGIIDQLPFVDEREHAKAA